MERMLIEEQEKETPFVDFNFDNGLFILSGYSLPPDPFPFYDPIIGQVKEYLKDPEKSVVFEMRLVYFNTASSKKILDLMNLFPNGSLIKWYYAKDDEDMIEAGQDYSGILDHELRFEFIEVV